MLSHVTIIIGVDVPNKMVSTKMLCKFCFASKIMK